eukprot:1054939-Rhodomonas_salina.2
MELLGRFGTREKFLCRWQLGSVTANRLQGGCGRLLLISQCTLVDFAAHGTDAGLVRCGQRNRNGCAVARGGGGGQREHGIGSRRYRRCAPLSAIPLRARYAMSSTEPAFVAIGLRERYATCGTEPAYGAVQDASVVVVQASLPPPT